MQTKPIAIVTMVYDDVAYFKIWLRYWTKRLPASSLYVIVHGATDELLDLAKGVTAIPMNRPPSYPKMEQDRWRMLSHFVSGLTVMHDVVVYNDVDEILVLDPLVGNDVVAALLEASAPVSSPLGLEVIHRADLEPHPIDLAKPVLSQRPHVRPSNFFCKPCIVRTPVRWSRGGHFANHPELHFVKGLYNIHLRNFDDDQFRERAKKRRETTATNIGENKQQRRQWRVSGEALEKQLVEHRQYPIRALAPNEEPNTFSVVRPMIKRAEMQSESKGGFRIFRFHEQKALQALPKRFHDLV